MNKDVQYLRIIVDCIRVCGSYTPKFGQGRKEGLTLEEFQDLYRKDPFYGWFGLDNPMMYAAHKAAGGITSVYRQIGIGCERIFRRILQDALGLSEDEVVWSYEITTPEGKKRKLSLDGRIPSNSIRNNAAKMRFHNWMKQSAASPGVDERVFHSLTGTVFECAAGIQEQGQ